MKKVNINTKDCKMKKIMISQPMNGKTDEEIKKFLLEMNGSESTKDIPKSKYEYLCNEIQKVAV